MFSTTYNEKEKLWYGPKIPSVYNPKISLGQALLNSMLLYGSKVAQISDNNGYCMTFEEMRIKTIRAAQNLQALGLKRRQVIGFFGRNSHNFAPMHFAAIAIGCPTLTIDPNFQQNETIHILKVAKPDLMCCDVDKYEVLTNCLSELGNKAKIFTFGGSVGDSETVESLFQETNEEDQFISEEVDGPNECAVLSCSSGTTGLLKGICMSHAALLDSISHYGINKSDDVIFNPGSIYWSGIMILLFRATITGATRIITTEPFSPELQIHIIEKYNVTFVQNVPHTMAAMVNSERFQKSYIPCLKYFLTGGSEVPVHTLNKLKTAFPNVNAQIGYGMTELSGGVMLNVCFKIVNSDGQRCGVNEDGEICVKKNIPFLGYYEKPEATKEFFDEEGFMKTGDIGNFDEDGYLCVTGRKKDLIKYNCMHISPAEMDTCLTKSPYIKEACVVGIPETLTGNQIPTALVVRSEGSRISEEEVADLITRHFNGDHYKLRGSVFFVDSLPTTHSGKLQRQKALEVAVELYSSRKNLKI